MDGTPVTQVESAAFGPYRIHEVLGRGGMGVVHRAYDSVHRRTVALKRLSPTAVDDRYRARFRRESRLAGGLRHPHVVPVHAFGEIDGQLYLDMMLVEGTDLRREIGAGLGPEPAIAILAQVAEALDAAHAAGLVHRDVKPSNILVDGDGQAYLADFGIARETSAEATELTASGAVLGTWDYLAPERLSGRPVDGRADQYALACVLFECLTGRLPHPVADPAAKVAGHLLRPPPAPSLFVPTISPALDQVVLRGMAKDPARRFPSATALLEAAGAALADGGTAAPVPRARDQAWLMRAVVRSAAPRRRPSAPTLDGPHPACPYPGLRSFEPDDAAWFHGRDHVVTDLLVRLAEQRDASEPVVLVGASGSGKSSVLRAGLLPALARDGTTGQGPGPQVVCTPGPDPIGALATALRPLVDAEPDELESVLRGSPAGFGAWLARTRGPDADPPVVVVDQFEELFVADVPEADRAAFATALAGAHPALVLLAVRADLVQRCIELPALLPALAAPVLLGPMTATQLREAIVTPAHDAGITVEPGLPERLVADLGVRDDAAYDPAALPRLAHALRETWNEGDGTALTFAGYRRAGGVDGAIARTAEQVYAALDEAGQQAARAVLLRLVAVSDEGVVGRRRVPVHQLGALTGRPDVVDRLIGARLLTVEATGAQLGHEALLTAWPRLRDWLETDRADLVHHRRLTESVQVWDESGRDDDDLYRGARLAAVNAWRESAGPRLAPVEQEFLDRSDAADRAGLVSVRRRARRLRALVAALSVLLLVAGGAVVVATRLRADAVAAQQLSLSREYAASSALAADVDPRRAAMLALAAWQAGPTVEARSVLLGTASDPYRGTITTADATTSTDPSGTAAPVGTGAVTAVAVTRDGRTAATGERTGPLQLWDVASRRELGRLGDPGWYSAASFSADGRLLGAVEQNAHVGGLWSVADRRMLFRTSEPTFDIAVAPDGRTFATVAGTGQVVIRDTASLAELRRFPVGISLRMAYSADGSLIATTDRDKIDVTRVADGTRVATLSGHTDTVNSVAFDPGGDRLVSTSNDGTIRLWDTATWAQVRSLASPEGPANSAVFRSDDLLVSGDSGSGVYSWDPTNGVGFGRSPGTANGTIRIAASGDGRTVLSGDLSGTVTVWEFGHRSFALSDLSVTSVAPQPHGPLLAAVSGDGSGWLWDRTRGGPPRRLVGPDGHLKDARWSPDGTRLATVAGTGTLVLWDPVLGTPVGRFDRPGAQLTYAAFSPDGRTLAVTAYGQADGGEVLLLDAATLTVRHRWTIGAPGPDGASDDVAGGIAVSPDGRLLAVPLFVGRIDLLDVTDPTAPVRSLAGHTTLATDAQFAPDGTVLATSGGDRTVRLWRVSDGRQTGSFATESAVRAVAFSPDGRVLAAAGQDTVLRLWDVPDRQPLALLERHVQSLNDVAFDEDGRLVSAAADGVVQLWDLDPDHAVDDLCTALDPATIADQWRSLGADPAAQPHCPG